MNTVNKTEMNLIKSRALVALFAMLLGALMMLPIITSAKEGKKPENSASVNMHAFQNNGFAGITVRSLEEGKFTLTVESRTKSDVYYDKVLRAPEEFAKIFDFSNLEDGEYTLNVKSKGDVKTKHFDVENGKVKIYHEDLVKPTLTVQGNKALLELSNLNEFEYSIRVVDENGEELSAFTKSDKNIKKVFDFSKSEAGKYQIIASSNKTSYAFNFTK